MEPRSLFKSFFIVWIVTAILGLTMSGVLIYVACHFLAKVW
jgi:hypothetical protein